MWNVGKVRLGNYRCVCGESLHEALGSLNFWWGLNRDVIPREIRTDGLLRNAGSPF